EAVQQPAGVQQPAATQQPAAAPKPAAEQPAYIQPAPPQATPGFAQPAQSPGAAPSPEKTTPLSVWAYLGIMIVTCIPILGFIMILVWSFGSSFNRNTKNFARAILILWIVGFILTIVTIITYWSLLSGLMNEFNTFTTGFPA
ncbi:MAG: hypothetical protein ACM3XR_10720, partial [Bacillota bacterium]